MEPAASHTWAYLTLGAGATLVVVSFRFADHADDAYQDYLDETDPGRIDRLYDRTVLYDRLASGSLLTGEALFAAGVYLRFLRRPHPARVGLTMEAGRCAVWYRF